MSDKNDLELQDDIDKDILSDGDFFSSPKETKKGIEPLSPDQSKVVHKSYSSEGFSEEGCVPELRGGDFPNEYIELVDRIQIDYRFFPRINFSEAYRELADLTVKSCPTPTLQVLNDEIQKVQAAKDRLSEMFIDVLKCYTFKKRAVDILSDSWGKYSVEKSADKRKGDGVFRLSNFIADFAVTEGLLKSCTHILRNLDSLHESLSRRITIFQLTMKLGDIGRGALPDYDFTPSSANIDSDLFENKANETSSNTKEGAEPELENF